MQLVGYRFSSIGFGADNEVDLGPTATTAKTTSVDEEDPCAASVSVCRTLRCPYGVERYANHTPSPLLL